LGLAWGQGEDPLPPLLDDFVGSEPVWEEGVQAGVGAVIVELADVAEC
jgi:hypothetical protein